MEVIVSGRHIDIDDDLKAYTEEKMLKLADEYAKLTSARVVMEQERNWQIVEAHVNGKHLTLNATARSSDMSVSVDAAVEKLEKQLRRYLERVQDHRVNGEKPWDVQGDETEPEEEWEEGVE